MTYTMTSSVHTGAQINHKHNAWKEYREALAHVDKTKTQYNEIMIDIYKNTYDMKADSLAIVNKRQEKVYEKMINAYIKDVNKRPDLYSQRPYFINEILGPSKLVQMSQLTTLDDVLNTLNKTDIKKALKEEMMAQLYDPNKREALIQELKDTNHYIEHQNNLSKKQLKTLDNEVQFNEQRKRLAEALSNHKVKLPDGSYKTVQDIILEKNLTIKEESRKYSIEKELSKMTSTQRGQKKVSLIQEQEAIIQLSSSEELKKAGLNPNQIKEILKETTNNWIAEHKDNACITQVAIHMDEETPHVHISYVPCYYDANKKQGLSIGYSNHECDMRCLTQAERESRIKEVSKIYRLENGYEINKFDKKRFEYSAYERHTEKYFQDACDKLQIDVLIHNDYKSKTRGGQAAHKEDLEKDIENQEYKNKYNELVNAVNYSIDEKQTEIDNMKDSNLFNHKKDEKQKELDDFKRNLNKFKLLDETNKSIREKNLDTKEFNLNNEKTALVIELKQLEKDKEKLHQEQSAFESNKKAIRKELQEELDNQYQEKMNNIKEDILKDDIVRSLVEKNEKLNSQLNEQSTAISYKDDLIANHERFEDGMFQDIAHFISQSPDYNVDDILPRFDKEVKERVNDKVNDILNDNFKNNYKDLEK